MIRLGIAGLGRIGKSHALNLQRLPACQLVAACSLVEEELQWAKDAFKPEALYRDYQQLLEHPGLDAVFLATSTDVHAEQICAAIRAGKHTFCEKPMGSSIAECQQVVKTVEQEGGGLCFSLGFVRRFDPAYRQAFDLIQAGAIGRPYMVRSQTCDHRDFAPFQIDFIDRAGGIYHDMAVHDIDLVRWLMGCEIVSAYALSNSLAFPEFGQKGDADNAIISCECSGGELALIQLNRNSSSGHGTLAEIYGSEGTIRIGFRHSNTDVEVLDQHGVRNSCVYTFFDRFGDAFRLEAEEFIHCVANNLRSSTKVSDGLAATVAAEAFTVSHRQRRVVQLDELLALTES